MLIKTRLNQVYIQALQAWDQISILSAKIFKPFGLYFKDEKVFSKVRDREPAQEFK